MPSTDILPGYIWSNGESRYRSIQTGRFVSRADITELLSTQTQTAESRMMNLATAFHEKRISPASFVEQMRTEQRRLTLQNQALAAGGFDRLTQTDYGRAGASLRQQYAKISGTAQDVVDGKVSLPQLLNRIRGYTGEARRLYWLTLRDNPPVTPDGMVAIEKRVLGDADHCLQCPQYAEWSWQLLGSIPLPTEQCDCGVRCRCHNTIAIVPEAELDQWITKPMTNVEWTPK